MGGHLLVVVVPGLYRDLPHWEEMGRSLRAIGAFGRHDSCTWKIYDHKLSIISRRRFAPIARDLEVWIADRWEDCERPEHIVLVGHSAGALLVRRAWLISVARRKASARAQGVWGNHVRRFVLFAGLSRGLRFESGAWRKLGTRLAEFVPGAFSFEECLRGSAFITNLRIDWMRHIAALDPRSAPAMVELLGTDDRSVDKADSLDLDLFPASHPIAIRAADHRNLHHLKGVPDCKARLRWFARAITGKVEPPAPHQPTAANGKDVLLIVHGIRASNVDGWVKQATEAAHRLWPEVIVTAPNYGSLSALRFALPNVRKRYVRAFRDFYTESLSKYRPDRISALCHSHGTYALGHSLTEFQSIHLERVALAGSVLPAEFDWSGLIKAERVKAVRNDAGAGDVPVAILCRGLRSLFMRDVGTGGFDGFRGGDVTEVRFHGGGHSAMLTPENLDSMIRFLKGDAEPLPKTQSARGWVRTLSSLMIYFAPILVGCLIALGVFLAWQFGLPGLIGFIVPFAIAWIVLDVY